MAARRGGLGKGLDSLIPKKIRHISFDEDSDMDSRESELDEDDLDPVSAENPDEGFALPCREIALEHRHQHIDSTFGECPRQIAGTA